MCEHLRTISDNYGETCLECGAVIAGFGYGLEAATCQHIFIPYDDDYEICPYCEELRPLENKRRLT